MQAKFWTKNRVKILWSLLLPLILLNIALYKTQYPDLILAILFYCYIIAPFFAHKFGHALVKNQDTEEFDFADVSYSSQQIANISSSIFLRSMISCWAALFLQALITIQDQSGMTLFIVLAIKSISFIMPYFMHHLFCFKKDLPLSCFLLWKLGLNGSYSSNSTSSNRRDNTPCSGAMGSPRNGTYSSGGHTISGGHIR